VTASIGVSTTTLTTKSTSELIAEADQGLYRSKHGGRNQVTHFASMEVGLTEEVEADDKISSASI